MSLFHRHTAEGTPVQRGTLFMLARYMELPFLRISYALLRGRLKFIGRTRVFREIAGRIIYRPIATIGDRARAVPFEALINHIDSVEGEIAVGSCRCRATNHACDHPLETDIVIRTGYEAFTSAFPRNYRRIDRAEAKRIVTECHSLGMFHMVFYHCPATGCAEYAICNCCTCGCTIHMINRDLGDEMFPMFEPHWAAVTDPGKCDGSADCVAVCPFGARTVADGKSVTSGCVGCGLCVAACPREAITMKPLHTHSHGESHI
ncbi:MAG TPA: 4Fe-4S binding protein [bacterium]|nr:4Fe-4S binding protein [bacterium]